MNALVVGYGSIGARHARLLTELGCHTAVVSRRRIDFPAVYGDLSHALAAEHPDYVVVANETSQHHETLMQLGETGYAGSVLVEKPLFHRHIAFPRQAFRQASVAYNLRFHPVIDRLRMLLKGERIISTHAYAGQYLPDWRPATDYRTSYSASREKGGGVLRDLSHELDYLTWILGGWLRVAAVGGHYSTLEISSDDVFALTLVTQACPVVSLQLNYLDRNARRFVVINTARHTIVADLIGGTITVDRETESFVTERDFTYKAMHEAALSGRHDALCSLDEALEILRLIEAAEQAAERKEWVTR